MRQYVLLNSGGILTCRTSGKVTTGTVSIFDAGGNATSVAATSLTDLGSRSASTASADARTITVASSTGFVAEDTVKIADSYGRSEHHVLSGAGNGLLFTHDCLLASYTDGYTETTEVSYTVASDLFTQVATNCRARFTLDGTVTDIVFDVLNSPITQPITVENLAELDPTAQNQLPSSAANWGKTLERSWDRLIHYLTSAGLYPQFAIDKEQLQLLHHLSFRWALAEMGIEPHSDWIAGGAIGYFRSEFFSTLESLKVRWLDKSEDLVPTEDEENRSKQTRVII